MTCFLSDIRLAGPALIEPAADRVQAPSEHLGWWTTRGAVLRRRMSHGRDQRCPGVSSSTAATYYVLDPLIPAPVPPGGAGGVGSSDDRRERHECVRTSRSRWQAS